MLESTVRAQEEAVVAEKQQSAREWITPEVTKLDLETAQQTG